MDKLYNYTPDGYCGDEDNGQTSAWYVFSALGFYPVTPGTDEYVFGSPLFNKITLDFGRWKKLVIEAPDNSKENIYVKNIRMNGRKVTTNFITHSNLQKGGKLVFSMTATPDTLRGTRPESFPYSMSKK
jgi:putative alpha-1,2-mannosidase